MAVQLRDAVVERFPEVKVFLKPIDPHAPRNRSRTGAFEVQMCFHSRFTSKHHKVLLFSKLQRGDFPDTKDLLHQLSELQANPPTGGASSWDPFEPKTKVDFAFDPDSFANHSTNPFFDPDPEEEDEGHAPEYNEIMREEQMEMGRGQEQADMVRQTATILQHLSRSISPHATRDNCVCRNMSCHGRRQRRQHRCQSLRQVMMPRRKPPEIGDGALSLARRALGTILKSTQTRMGSVREAMTNLVCHSNASP